MKPELIELNALREERGMKPLKSWKASNASLIETLTSMRSHVKTAKGEMIDADDAQKLEASELRLPTEKCDGTCGRAYAPDKLEMVGDRLLCVRCREVEAKVRVMPPSPALAAMHNRSQAIDRAVSRRMNGESVAKPSRVAKVAKASNAGRREVPDGCVSLVSIARELGIDPKVARAKMRRVSVPADFEVSRHVYRAHHKSWIKDALQRDMRKEKRT